MEANKSTCMTLLVILIITVKAQKVNAMTRVASSVGALSGLVPNQCECRSIKDGLVVHKSVCGSQVGLAAGQRFCRQRATRAVTSCRRRWVPILVDGTVLWATSDIESRSAPACDCGQQISTSPNCGPSAALLSCLCQVESNCRRDVGCRWDRTGPACGPFRIRDDYWTEASLFAKRRLGGDWLTCTTKGADNMACSQLVVRYYLAKHAKMCVGLGRYPTDQDYARVHNGGPKGCGSESTLPYWNKVKACLHMARMLKVG